MVKRLWSRETLVRLIGTTLYGALAVWLFITGGIPFLIAAAVVTLLAAYEFFRMTTRAGYHPPVVLGVAAALFLVFSAYFPPDLLRLGLTLILLVSAIWIGVRDVRSKTTFSGPGQGFATDWALVLLGAFYTGWLLSHAVLLRALPSGAQLLLTVTAGAVACDVTAYAIGSAFGRHPFFPAISPRKTWEGTIAGFVGAVIVVSLLGSRWGIPAPLAIGWGGLIGFLQISGDLIESKLKRVAGVKDSGSLIPAQGGILDVIDGFMFSIAISYYYLLFIVGPL